MKNLLLLILFAVIGFGSMAQKTYTVENDTVVTYQTDILEETQFVYFDNIFENPDGNDVWELDPWESDDGAISETESTVKAYYQYRRNGKGVREKRTTVIKYTPVVEIQRKIIYDIE